ncbi:MAG: carboxypeptidase regulatory-like domain-containing protein [Phycisphaerae bacterium]|nr:carboxypeptidase regulatory-like domain-containing protein [Phycisphaerae bacterium]
MTFQTIGRTCRVCAAITALAAVSIAAFAEDQQSTETQPRAACCKATDTPSTNAVPAQLARSATMEYVALNEPPGQQSSRRRERAMPNYKVVPVERGGTIEGVVKFEGKEPDAKVLNIVKDHETCDKGEKSRSAIKVDGKGRVAEAVVYLFDITQGRDFPKRESPPVIDQTNCTFQPHVMAVKAGEPVEVLNSDPVAHNINASQRIYTLFNVLQPQKDMRASQKFDRPGLVHIRCNVHDWMEAWVWVFRHPYYCVTAQDGAFKLEGVPAGKYQLAVWQETFGEKFVEVEVKDGETARLDLKVEAPKERQ